jgi:hypothetical protein
VGWCHREVRAAQSEPTVAPPGRPSGPGDTEEGSIKLLSPCSLLLFHYPTPPPLISWWPQGLSLLSSLPLPPWDPPTQISTFPLYLTLAPETPLLQPGPDALDTASMLWMLAVVSTGALMLQHY